VKLGILLFNGLDDASTKPLTIFLEIKEEGAANKVRGVECRELRQLGLIFYGRRWGKILATWIYGIWMTGSCHSFTMEGSSPPRGLAQKFCSPGSMAADGRTEEDLLGILS